MTALYKNRQEAGRELARSLGAYAGREDVCVLAVSCGGLLVAVEVADALSAPLDMLVIQQISVPKHDAWQMEQALGVVASGGVRILSADLGDALHLQPQEIEQATVFAQKELTCKETAYRGGHSAPNIRGRIVILVDDGIETIFPMAAAVEVVKARGAARVVACAPVGSMHTCEQIALLADEVICPQQTGSATVALSYGEFPLVAAAEVSARLSRHIQKLRA